MKKKPKKRLRNPFVISTFNRKGGAHDQTSNKTKRRKEKKKTEELIKEYE